MSPKRTGLMKINRLDAETMTHDASSNVAGPPVDRLIDVPAAKHSNCIHFADASNPHAGGAVIACDSAVTFNPPAHGPPVGEPVTVRKYGSRHDVQVVLQAMQGVPQQQLQLHVNAAIC